MKVYSGTLLRPHCLLLLLVTNISSASENCKPEVNKFLLTEISTSAAAEFVQCLYLEVDEQGVPAGLRLTSPGSRADKTFSNEMIKTGAVFRKKGKRRIVVFYGPDLTPTKGGIAELNYLYRATFQKEQRRTLGLTVQTDTNYWKLFHAANPGSAIKSMHFVSNFCGLFFFQYECGVKKIILELENDSKVTIDRDGM